MHELRTNLHRAKKTLSGFHEYFIAVILILSQFGPKSVGMMITGQLPMYSKGFTTTAETVSCNLTIRETKKQGDQKQQFVGYPRREVVINFFVL